eukprot:3342669-Pleurochrysis_carterae.AAC.1
MADDNVENVEGAAEQTTARKRRRGYIKKKALVGAGGGRDGSGGIGADGRGGRGAGIGQGGGSGGVAAGGVPKRQRPQSGRAVEENGGGADDSGKEDPQDDEEKQDSTVRDSGGGRGRAHGRARARGGRSSRGAHGVDAGRGRGESLDAVTRAAAVGPASCADKEVDVKELLVEGKESVKSFIPVLQPPGAVLERTVIADDVDTADAEQEMQFLKHVQTPTKQAIE